MQVERTTIGMMSNQALNIINDNLNGMSRLQEQLASGKRINRISDDPLALTRLQALTNTMTQDDQYIKNIDGALSEAQIADNTLNSVIDIIQRAKELATQSANTSTSQQGMNAIALEVDQLINQIVQLSNTSIGDKFLFGGKQTGAPPFARTNDDVAYTGNAPTDAWQRNVEISPNVDVTMNLNGESVFGQVGVTAPGPPPVFSAASTGLFKTLVNLKLNLQQGDKTEIRLRLDDIDNSLSTVSSQQANLGALVNRLDSTKARINDRRAVLTQQYAAIQAVDLPSLVTNLQQQQNTYQASLSVVAKIQQTTLLDYI